MAGYQNSKRAGQCADPSLFDQIIAFENLHRAALRSRKGKRHRKEVAAFFANLEENLIQLQNELIWHQYRVGRYRNFYVYEPKKRLVAALPFRDRVVQHAIVNVIEPLFDQRFIDDSFACRSSKGTHAGADRAQQFIRIVQRNYGQPYVLKADIYHYFASIDHDIAKQLLARRISCQKTLQLLSDIIDSSPGKGIPLGNLTSQLVANIYLHELDWFAKHVLHIRYYIRYMDDFVITHHDKKQLQIWRQAIEGFLWRELRLKTNNKTQVFPVGYRGRALDFLGYRIYTTHRLLRKNSIKRIKAKLKQYRQSLTKGRLSLTQIRVRLQSWLGHCRHCHSYLLRKKLLGQSLKRE